MNRGRFLKIAVGTVLAPYLARIPAGQAAVVPAAETTLTVSGGYLQVGDVVRNMATSESFRVTRVSGREVTVVRGVGLRPAAPMAADDDLLIVGSASQEGAPLGDRCDLMPRTDKVA